MPGPFDPSMGGYQLGMPGGDPYAAAAFGMQPEPAMFQAYQQANGAALASLMRPNGMGPGGPGAGGPGPAPAAPSSTGPGSAGTTPTAAGSGSSAPVPSGGSSGKPAAEADGAAAGKADGGGSKPSAALLGSQLFASFVA